jgi:hypothetical protein
VSGFGFNSKGKTWNSEPHRGKNKKFEAQNPKFETNPHAQKLENSKPGASEWCFEFSPVLGLFGFEFVSNFDIWISDFIELI